MRTTQLAPQRRDVTRVLPDADPAATVASPHRHDAVHTSDAALLPVGSRIAEFEVTRVIGQGGFGAVYQAWDHSLERVVALKEYLPLSLSVRQSDGTVVAQSERSKDTFDLGMRSFINEARLLAQFDHPSLVKVYRFWQERGTAYMAMPFYRGDTLRQTIETMPGGVDEAWLLRIMDGVTQALAVMHNAHCYHRDIAPDNIILLEGSGLPVVLDFGAARRVITDKTQAITVILKPGYAPIEQYAEMPDMSQGAWTDVYALAGVMHVAVTGRPPPPSVARLLSDSYAPLAHNETLRQRYSVQLLSAIDAGLGVRPEQRPQSMAELRALHWASAARTAIAAVPSHASSRPQTLIQPQATGTVPIALPSQAVLRARAVAVAAGGARGSWRQLVDDETRTQGIAAAPLRRTPSRPWADGARRRHHFRAGTTSAAGAAAATARPAAPVTPLPSRCCRSPTAPRPDSRWWRRRRRAMSPSARTASRSRCAASAMAMPMSTCCRRTAPCSCCSPTSSTSTTRSAPTSPRRCRAHPGR